MPDILDNPSTDMASHRTGMAFQRTRLAADRTLMAVIRTALSMMSFGFTIHKLAQSLKEQGLLKSDDTERTFGGALILIAVALLIMGIFYHLRFMYGLRTERRKMVKDGMLHGDDKFPPSLTLITAMLLLIVGMVTTYSLLL